MSRKSAAAKILLVAKRSTLERFRDDKGDQRIAALLERGDASVAKLEASHAIHAQTVKRAEAKLAELELAWERRSMDDSLAGEWDLVLTLGGDGTLLWVSHAVGAGTPVLAINSAPVTSVGYFCGTGPEDLEKNIARSVVGDLPKSKLHRMTVELNGEVLSSRVLNDILFCHEVPAAATRYIIQHGEVVEEQISSGLWIGPAAGSTAAQRSAGGKVLALQSKKLQYVVRELYAPEDTRFELEKGFVRPGDELCIKSKIRNGRIYVDGAQKVTTIDIGDELRFRLSDEPLTLLNIRDLRKKSSDERESKAAE